MEVPAVLRNALIEAMGGWGPFTVREITSLFDDHGFPGRGVTDPQQGVRRSEAAEHIAAIDWADHDARQRLIALTSDVLEFYPEAPDDPPNAPGRRLRRALDRIDAPPAIAAEVGRHVERTTDLDDPFDVWPPNRIRLFFSHASEQRLLVGQVAEVLETWPFACFVAHEEIEPTLDWQDVIKSALASCHALVAFTSDEFHASQWCNQELGWAFGLGLVIIPVRLTRDPMGFAGAIQAVPGSMTDDPVEMGQRVATALMTSVFRRTRPGADLLVDPLADAIITKFVASGAQDLALRRFAFLQRVPRSLWTPERRLRIEQSFERRHIRDAVLPDGTPLPQAVARLWA